MSDGEIPFPEPVEPATSAPKLPLNETDMCKRIKVRYEPDHAVIYNVANGTGVQTIRYADALAFGLWPSRGHMLSGFEVKISRSDWIREMKAPAKAEEIARFCDYWWLVVSDEKIIYPGELPENWGLLIPYRDGLKVRHQAKKLEAQPWSRSFMAAMFRRVHENMVNVGDIEDKVKAARQAGLDERNWRYNDAVRDRDALNRRLEEFEQASGIKIDEHSWDLGDVGKVVKILKHQGPVAVLENLKRAANTITSVKQYLDESVESMTKHLNLPPDTQEENDAEPATSSNE